MDIDNGSYQALKVWLRSAVALLALFLIYFIWTNPPSFLVRSVSVSLQDTVDCGALRLPTQRLSAVDVSCGAQRSSIAAYLLLETLLEQCAAAVLPFLLRCCQ